MHIIGISMGGMIAQELAIRHPELADKLVLVSTTAGNPNSVGDPAYDPRYDLDGDGDIDIVDIMRVASRWGWVCSSGE